MWLDRPALVPAAASDDTAMRLDAMQVELDQGCAIEAVSLRESVRADGHRSDRRWHRWSAVVSDVGVTDALAIPLETNSRCVGALTAYTRSTTGFADDAVVVGESLAIQIAVGLSAAREIDQRGEAMTSRTVIGQAEGILMERLGLSDAQAFGYLSRVSQDHNRKLVDIARELVETGRLSNADVSGESRTGRDISA